MYLILPMHIIICMLFCLAKETSEEVMLEFFLKNTLIEESILKYKITIELHTKLYIYILKF